MPSPSTLLPASAADDDAAAVTILGDLVCFRSDEKQREGVLNCCTSPCMHIAVGAQQDPCKRT